MYSYGLPHMAEQKQDDQLEHTYSSYMRIRDVALKTWRKRWTIGRIGESGSGISVLAARHDDYDEIGIIPGIMFFLSLDSLDSSLDAQLTKLIFDIFVYFPRAPNTSGITVTFMLRDILVLWYNPGICQIFLYSFIFTLWSAKNSKSTRE